MTATIQDVVLDIVRDNPQLSNEQVAELIQQRIPGSTTSAASVSSIKSKAKAKGLLQSGAAGNAMETGFVPATFSPEELPEESEEERSSRIRTRFSVLERMADKVADGLLPALIVSGPPGLGKSFTIEQVLSDRYGDPITPEVALQEAKDAGEEDVGIAGWDLISGSITAPGLILSLFAMRNGGVVVLDDCDDVFRDEACLNLLKAVLDSSERRLVSYRKRAHWMEEFGIPSTFEFKGSVVFCTNVDFEAAISKGSSMAPHFSALIDRSLYLSLTMRTQADFITRIRQVCIEDGLLVRKGLSGEQAQEVFDFVVENARRFYGLSLRLMGQIATVYLSDAETWRDDVEVTKMRTF